MGEQLPYHHYSMPTTGHQQVAHVHEMHLKLKMGQVIITGTSQEWNSWNGMANFFSVVTQPSVGHAANMYAYCPPGQHANVHYNHRIY